MRRMLVSIGILLSVALLWAAPATASPATATAGGTTGPGSVVVDGAVSMPHTYSASALAGLPAETLPFTVPTPFGPVHTTVTGVSLDHLVTLAAPILVNAKNASLRVTVTVSGAFDRTVTFTLGELDANFGNHDAVVATRIGGVPLGDDPTVVVPGDTNPGRAVLAVREITVAVTNPAAVVPPTSGSLDVEVGHRSVVLPAALLARLPQQTLSVSFLAGSGAQTHLERGPTLAAVLAAAGSPSCPTTSVAGVGSDDYVAAVTPAEATVGGRPLLISLNQDGTPLAQPRLIADGDVKGGRDVSDLVDLVIGQGHGLRQ